MTDENAPQTTGSDNDHIVEFIKQDAERLLKKPNNFPQENHHYLKDYTCPCSIKTYSEKTITDTNKDDFINKYKEAKLFFLVNYHLHTLYPPGKIKQNEQHNEYPLFNFILGFLTRKTTVPESQVGGGNLDEIIRIARTDTQNSQNSQNSQKIPDEFNLDDQCNNVDESDGILAIIELLEMYLGTLDVIELFKKKINNTNEICSEIEEYKLKNKDYLDYLDIHGFDLDVINNEYEEKSFFVGEKVQYNGRIRYIKEIGLYDDSSTCVKLHTRSPWSFFATPRNNKLSMPPGTSNDKKIPIDKIKKLPEKRLYNYYQILGIPKSSIEDSKPSHIDLYISFAKRLYELVRYIFTLTKFKKYVQKYNPADNYIHKETFEYRFIDLFDDIETTNTTNTTNTGNTGNTGNTTNAGNAGNAENTSTPVEKQKVLNDIEAINKKYSEYIKIEFDDFHVSTDPVSMLFLYTHHGMNLITNQNRVYSSKYVHLNPVNPITTHIQPIEEDNKKISGFNTIENKSGGGLLRTMSRGIVYVGDKVLYAGEKMTKSTYDFLWSYNERKNQKFHKNIEYKLYILLDALDIFVNENEFKKYKNYYKKYYGIEYHHTLTPNNTFKLKTGLSFLPSNLSHINKRDFVFENNVIDNKSEHFIENAILSCNLPKKQEVYIPIKYNKLIDDSSSPTLPCIILS